MTERSINRHIHGVFRRVLDSFIGAVSAFAPGDLVDWRNPAPSTE